MQQTQFLQDQLLQLRQLDTQTGIANLQAGTNLFLGGLQAQTTIDVSRMDNETRVRLQQIGIEGNINLQELTHSQRIEIENMFNEPWRRAEFQLGLAQTRTQLEISALNAWSAGVQSLNGLDLDDASRNRAMTFFNNLVSDMQSISDRNLDPSSWNFDWNSLFGGGG